MPNIFLLGQSGLIEMSQQPYESEDLLQTLIAQYPSVLAGDQFGLEEPRRWLLITREAGVPDASGASDRWSLDHLFLDQDGVPTFVEVKRGSDTRLRREVVGQMLDYAANAVAYWPIAGIRRSFESNSSTSSSETAEDRLLAFLQISNTNAEADIERFWSSVETNLRARRIRLVFVADTIPSELRCVIEFLNEEMRSVEVLAIEIRQFVAPGVTTLVPTVIGQTAKAQAQRAPAASREWDRDSFFAELESRKGEAYVKVAQKIFEWVQRSFARVVWGRGNREGALIAVIQKAKGAAYPFSVRTNGKIVFLGRWLPGNPPFDKPELVQELTQRMNRVAGTRFEASQMYGYPSFDLMDLDDATSMLAFEQCMEWLQSQILTGSSIAESSATD